MKSILKKVLKVFSQTLYFWRSYWTKKEDKIWVFGAIRGQKYMENSKYLYEYIHYHTDIKAVWLTKNPQVIKYLNSKELPVFNMHSKIGLQYARRAKVAVMTHRGNNQWSDLPFYAFSKKTKIIQLWHGLPLKKVGFDDKLYSFRHDESSVKFKLKKILKETILPYKMYNNRHDILVALSNESKKIFASAFRMPHEKVIITGYPRNDVLFKENHSIDTHTLKKHIIYMPTFRDKAGTNFDLFLQYGFDVDKLDQFLEQENMQLYIKLHPFNKPSEEMLRQIMFSQNIRFLDYDAIYEVINHFDMLITDYSSIYFDYLLLDRPIIFAPFDKEIYMEKDREFYFDYDEVTPGPKAMNWEEVMTSLQMFNKDSQMYTNERQLIKDKFHTHQDNKSTQRVYEAILDTINEK